MSYNIRVRVIQNEPAKWFNIMEKTVWHYANGGTWAECDGEQTLSIGGSGMSGTLRFMNPEGEYFLVALGIHNYKRWCDIMADLSSSNTGVEIHPQYCGGGNQSQVPPKQNGELKKLTKKGATITIKYYKEDGNNL